MTKFFPDTDQYNADVTDIDYINKPIRKAVAALNSLDRENIEKNSLTSTKIKKFALNKFTREYSGTTYNYEVGEISRGWFTIPQTKHTISVKEGMLVVEFCGSIRRYGIADDFPPWTVGLFVDGEMVAETGFIYSQEHGINLHAAIPVINKNVEIYAAFKGDLYTPTVGGPTTNTIFTMKTFMCWTRNAKR